MEEKKLKSLLKFYKKNEVEIELVSKIRGGLIVKGKIIKLCRFFRKYIIVKSKEGALIKVFLEDILYDTLVPLDFIKEIEAERKEIEKVEKNSKENDKKRSPIPPKLRFDVLRRDKYSCQYCGAAGPKVELEVDHVIPVSRGGTDDINNLKTICFDCNRGKGDRLK